MAAAATVAAATVVSLGWLAVIGLDEASPPPFSPSPEGESTPTVALPEWWSPMPGATVQTPVLYDDGRVRTGTVALFVDAGPDEVVEFYRRRLHEAGYVVDDLATRSGVAAVLRVRRADGGAVTLTAFPGSALIRFDEPVAGRPEGGERVNGQRPP